MAARIASSLPAFALAAVLAAACQSAPPRPQAPNALVTIYAPAAPPVTETPPPTLTPAPTATPPATATSEPAITASPTIAAPPPTATPAVLILLDQAQIAPTHTSPPQPTTAPTVTPIPVASSSCPAASSAAFALTGIVGPAYKDNRLTDANADLRLSLLGFAPAYAVSEFTLVDYNGATDPDAPRLDGLFSPNRIPSISAVYQRYDWRWDESAEPPYGSRGNVNADWAVSVVGFALSPGEGVYLPERGADIGGFTAMVLFAAEQELTLAYFRQDSVTDGYVVHLMNLCVDPNLVALYRAQTAGGKRATSNLPALRNDQQIGVAGAGPLIVAVRDRGVFLDPRSRKDWWQ
jgi:hypothetical protein